MISYISRFNASARSAACETFFMESLFTSMYEMMQEQYFGQVKYLDVCDIWDEARIMTKEILSSTQPHLKVSFYMHELFKRTEYVVDEPRGLRSKAGEYNVYSLTDEERDEVFFYICIDSFYMMWRTYILTKDEKIKKAAEKIVSNLEDSGTGVDEEGIKKFVEKAIQDGEVVADIDYARQGGINFNNGNQVVLTYLDPSLVPKGSSVAERRKAQSNDDTPSHTALTAEIERLRSELAEYQATPIESGKVNLSRAINLLKDSCPTVFDIRTCTDEEKDELYGALAYLFNSDPATIKDYLKPSRTYNVQSSDEMNEYDKQTIVMKRHFRKCVRYISDKDID